MSEDKGHASGQVESGDTSKRVGDEGVRERGGTDPSGRNRSADVPSASRRHRGG